MTLLILRLIHITFGVFWAGTAIFIALFLEPTVRSLGPDGGKFMQRLMSGSYLKVMPAASGLTLLSGILLLWEVSAGFETAFLLSPMGLALVAGGTATILAFSTGFTLIKPSGVRMLALGAEIAKAGGPPKPEQTAEIQLLQGKIKFGGRLVAGLLTFTVLTMAAARYLHW